MEIKHTSPIPAPRRSDNRIPLQAPGSRIRHLPKTQREEGLPAYFAPYVEVETCVGALDRGADDEVLACGFGAHDRDWRGGGFGGGQGLEVEVEDGGLYAAELLVGRLVGWLMGGDGEGGLTYGFVVAFVWRGERAGEGILRTLGRRLRTRLRRRKRGMVENMMLYWMARCIVLQRQRYKKSNQCKRYFGEEETIIITLCNELNFSVG